MLKYLFTAVYENGETFQQTQDDRSLIREGGSAYTDVDQSRLRSFILSNGVDAEYRIDLESLTFYINGQPFILHGIEDLPISDIELVFYRLRTHHVDASVKGTNVDLIEGSEREDPVIYLLGWKAKVKGIETQRCIRFE